MVLNLLNRNCKMRHLLVLVFIMAVTLSCKKDDPEVADIQPTAAFNIENLLTNWSTSIIIPSYEQYQTNVLELQKAASQFKASPSEINLTNVRSAWLSAYMAWQKVAMYEFGPAADITLRSETNIYPTDTAELKDLIKQGSININGANKLDVKGFPALDYLINSGSATKIVGRYTDSILGTNRLNYLEEVVNQIANNAESVNIKWSSNGGNYVNQFNGANGTDAGSSLGQVINALTQHIERHLRDGKLGIPNGNRNFSGTSLPGHVEALYYGNTSIELALENLNAIEAFYNGSNNDGVEGIGLDDYLISLGAEYNEGTLNDVIKAQFAACRNKLNAIPKPLKESLTSNKANVDEAVKELQRLIILFKADIPSATGVLITYQDNDGD